MKYCSNVHVWVHILIEDYYHLLGIDDGKVSLFGA